jgi:ATP-binding cassette subfamily B protein
MNQSDLHWPAARAIEGLELLARTARLPLSDRQKPAAETDAAVGADDLPRAAARLGLDVEPIDSPMGDVDGLLRSAGPAVIRLAADRLVMLIGRRGRKVRIVRPDHRVVSVAPADLREAMLAAEEAPLVAETERLVDEIGLPARRRRKVVSALLAERLRARKVQAGWLIRVPAGGSFRSQLIAAGARRKAILLVLTHAAQYVLAIVAWWLLGRAALLGHLDEGWLTAWALALFTLVPIQLSALFLQGRLAIDAGALLKQRLLAGAFKLEPEEIRREGAGQLLGRVIEAEAVESLALGGGLAAGLAVLELVLAAGVLALAAPWLAVLLAAWSAGCAVLGWVYYRRRGNWARQRISLTHDLIERMLGHRTRLAQQPRERWHDGEDEAVERYIQGSTVMDRSTVWLLALVPRGWMIVGLLGFSPLFVGGRPPVSLAVALGGILLGFRALDRLTNGLTNLAGAAIAWQQTSPVFRAASRMRVDENAPAAGASSADATTVPVLDATDLRFTHAGRAEPVLQGCTLSIGRHERLILQGSSGGGKSTLAALLSGLRTPQSGLLLLDGVDRHTVGPTAWRRRVALVPQFHENHVMLSTVAFNVLMGGEWPPAVDDFNRAETILRDLGLGGTLDRMPSGILQTVGETGWQLSHGERSRLFLARALLQNPDVLILDESFAQLDPDTMRLALDTVVSRARSVVLIAHP